MYDIYTGFRYLHKFRERTTSLKQKSIHQYVNTSKLTVIDENCPLFSYFLQLEENRNLLYKRGYFSKSEANSHSHILVPLLVKRVFQYNLHFQQSVIDSVNSILKPYEDQLIRADPLPSDISVPPFRRYKNLVTAHVRFGSGGADFADSNQFLKEDALTHFENCLSPNIRPNDLFFVASDSSKAKREFAKRYGKQFIHSREVSQHSAEASDHQVLIDVISDIIIASMGIRFVGTSASTFSAMCVLLGKADIVKYVGKLSSQCVQSSIYLPS